MVQQIPRQMAHPMNMQCFICRHVQQLLPPVLRIGIYIMPPRIRIQLLVRTMMQIFFFLRLMQWGLQLTKQNPDLGSSEKIGIMLKCGELREFYPLPGSPSVGRSLRSKSAFWIWIRIRMSMTMRIWNQICNSVYLSVEYRFSCFSNVQSGTGTVFHMRFQIWV